MDVYNRPVYRRAAVLLVLFFLHGGLALVFLRLNPPYRDSGAPLEVFTTIFFINPQSRLAPPPETARIPHRADRNLQHPVRPDAAISGLDTRVPAESPGSEAAPAVDWLAEAHRSASEITDRGKADRAAPSSPPASAHWNSRPLLEFTGHGLQVQIPVEIPGDIIDHCFGNMDLGSNRYGDTELAHNPTGHWELYQLKCALRKQPARGDLFDSLRKPSEPPK